MKNTIVGYFESFEKADRAVRELEKTGITREDLSVITRNPNADAYNADGSVNDDVSHEDENDPIGATTGAVVGGLTGLIVGIGGLMIPGIGPVLAAGPIAAALGAGVGAVSGAVAAPVLDSVMGLGVPEYEAEAYVEGIKRGGTLLTVHATDSRSIQIQDILERCGATDIDEHAQTWRENGWSADRTLEDTQAHTALSADAPNTSRSRPAMTAPKGRVDVDSMRGPRGMMESSRKPLENPVRVYSDIDADSLDNGQFQQDPTQNESQTRSHSKDPGGKSHPSQGRR